MKKRIIGILWVCVFLLVGCRKEQIKDVSQKETFTVTYNQKEKPVPYTKHYHLAGMNEGDFFILEDNGIYRLKGEEKEKIVEASGISYFAATDRYLYFFSSSAETDYEERLTIYDMQMKLKVEAAWEEEPCPILSYGNKVYLDLGNELLCYEEEDRSVRYTSYQIFEEDKPECIDEEYLQGLSHFDSYFVEWHGGNAFIFGRNKNEDYVFLKVIENLYDSDTEVQILIADTIEPVVEEVVLEEGDFDGHDAFGNGYVLKSGIKFFQRDCPYKLLEMKEEENCITWYQEGKNMDIGLILAKEYIRSKYNKSFSLTGGLDKGPCVGVYNDKVIYHCTVRVTFAREEKEEEK